MAAALVPAVWLITCDMDGTVQTQDSAPSADLTTLPNAITAWKAGGGLVRMDLAQTPPNVYLCAACVTKVTSWLAAFPT